VEFRWVGQVSRTVRAKFAACGAPITAQGCQPHRQAVRHLVGADVLLLPVPTLGANAVTTIPAKLYEYLAARRHIVLVGPEDGEPQRVVRSCEAGVCVPPSSAAIFQALQTLWHAWRDRRLPPGCPPNRLTPFLRRNLTQTLSVVLDNCIDRRKGLAGAARPDVPAETAAYLNIPLPSFDSASSAEAEAASVADRTGRSRVTAGSFGRNQ
jgi:hypothetical protein